MNFLLSTQNVFDYLVKQGISTQEERETSQVDLKTAKNFNLLLSFSNNRKLLVKQERYNQDGKTAGEFLNEWRIHEFFQKFPEVSYLRSFLSEAIHFNANDSIIIFNYLNDYCDLSEFYAKENIFPIEIATTIGTLLATIHRSTFNRHNYRKFFYQDNKIATIDPIHYVVNKLERLEPEIFGLATPNALKFFALYQRYESLKQAIAELADNLAPCCLTHNDLKLNNILLLNNKEQTISQPEQANSTIVRLIDWERCGWGDPAFDLGTIIGSYLLIWLNSLVISQTLSIEESLRLALTPLEYLQPSTASLAKAYLDNFPEILEYRSDFLRRVVQFSGFALIQQIRAMLQQNASLGNIGICMLQVAKTLLCRPEQSITTVFGVSASELTQINCIPA